MSEEIQIYKTYINNKIDEIKKEIEEILALYRDALYAVPNKSYLPIPPYFTIEASIYNDAIHFTKGCDKDGKPECLIKLDKIKDDIIDIVIANYKEATSDKSEIDKENIKETLEDYNASRNPMPYL